MGTPSKYLPPAPAVESINELMSSLSLPIPSRVESLKEAAEFHAIYLLHFSAEVASLLPVKTEPGGSATLVLRISGHHLPSYKTLNEMGIMSWVQQHTTIPIPKILRFDATENNPIGREFSLLERVKGVSVNKIYDTLDAEQKLHLVQQLTGYVIQLHSKPWSEGFVGGLRIGVDGQITKGPALEENYWFAAELNSIWHGSETVESLNPLRGWPFGSWSSYLSACLETYSHAIQVHESLLRFRHLVPRINRLIEAVQERYAAEINNASYVLAHKDLHFANVMCDPLTCDITAVLDWEFSGVVASPRWDPSRAFLWNCKRDDQSKQEQENLKKVFEAECQSQGAAWLLDQTKMNSRQEDVMTAVNYIRAIVEVCPRGQAQDKVDDWCIVAETAMDTLGI
jgi:aminoglycoside phosphotransferase (APT) family kinase protein